MSWLKDESGVTNDHCVWLSECYYTSANCDVWATFLQLNTNTDLILSQWWTDGQLKRVVYISDSVIDRSG